MSISLFNPTPLKQLKTLTPFQLETARLIVKPLELKDAAEVRRLAGDFAIADTTLNVPHPYPDGAAEEFIMSQLADFAKGEAVAFGLFRKDDGALVGCVGLTVTTRFKRGELGYWIGRPYWNLGYATEGARAVIEFGFGQRPLMGPASRWWNLHRIEATFFSRNPASGRVMQKLGMVQEGILRDHILKWNRYEDLVVYGIVNPAHRRI